MFHESFSVLVLCVLFPGGFAVPRLRVPFTWQSAAEWLSNSATLYLQKQP